MPDYSLRSTRGCWTCRVRRKKCDETHPICKLCQSLHITCHGYSNDRPEWMDNGDEEKAMIDNLKRSVRFNTRRRKTLQTKALGLLDSSFLVHPPRPSHDNLVRGQPVGYFDTYSVANKPVLEVCPVRQGREPRLIMHFFDHVFPLQFPGYRPLVEEGGRGWYLSLMSSNRTLYHPVLCLSAYHRQMTMKQTDTTHRDLNLGDLEMHNELSFKVLQQQLQNDAKSIGLKYRIGMLAGIVQMMFFQLLFFSNDQWRVHLEMLIIMINDVHVDILHLLNSNDPSVIAYDEIPAFLFFCGLLIWVDLQLSIYVGSTPRLEELHNQVLDEFPALFRLQNIIGCESWVLQIISRIANIHECEDVRGTVSKTNTIELRRKSKQIRDDLYRGLERIWKELQNKSRQSDRSPLETTRIFALAAMTYLHVTIYGPQADLVEIQASVHQTIHALQQLKDKNQLKVLHWPLYLTGCMALGEGREYILDLFSTSYAQYSGACTRNRYSEMLKRYWASREMKTDCNMWESDAGPPLFI